MALSTDKLTGIQIIWDADHGPENEGWYVRRVYLTPDEDEHTEDEATGPDSPGADATDEELIEDLLDADEITAGIPVEVIR